MILRQLLDPPTSTFTYLLGDEKTRQAILIDSVFEQHARDAALIRELDLDLRFTLDTHVHADHVTGAWLMKNTYGSAIAISKNSGVVDADRGLAHGEIIEAGGIRLQARATPGHTGGCMSFWCEAAQMIFTGDALLIRGAGRTDFQEGNPAQLFRSVREQIFALSDDTLIYPGHDYVGRTVTTVREEKKYNPRLGETVREQDFVGFMDNLGLPHPKQLEIALPANLRAGKPESGASSPVADWAPVVRTYAGVLQVEPEWVRTHQESVLLVDVRESAEILAGPMGTIDGALKVPLSALREQAPALPTDRPIVTFCPAGARSAMAATILEKAGLLRVANLRGGLFEWATLGFPLKRSEV